MRMNEVHRARRCNSQMSSALYCTPSAKVRNSVANVRVTSQHDGVVAPRWLSRVRQTVKLPVPGESRAKRKLADSSLTSQVRLDQFGTSDARIRPNNTGVA